MNKSNEQTEGFTILEVVLVLAIAGMIFLMVFIALPQMRRSQRDAERRDDMMMFVEAVKKFQSNNRGVLPGTLQSGDTYIDQGIFNNSPYDEFTWSGFYHQYLNPGSDVDEGDFRDPEGDFYALNATACAKDSSSNRCTGNEPEEGKMDYIIHINTGAICKDDYTEQSTNPRDFAVLYHTESSGIICYDSRN